MSNDKPLEQRKALGLMLAFAQLGAQAAIFLRWKPRAFRGVKEAPPRKERPAASAKPPRSAEHVAAVAAMREARRGKRIAKAERALAHKRRRQAAQLRRHYRGHPIPPPHFLNCHAQS